MMKRSALVAFVVVLAACENKNNQAASDAGAGDTGARDAAAVFDGANAAALVPLPLATVKYEDWLHRYTVDVPAGWAKLEQKTCSDTDCSESAVFRSEDMLLTLSGGPTATSLKGKLAPYQQAGCVNLESKPRGADWWIKGDTTKTAQPEHFVSAQKKGFGDTMSWSIQGPPSKAALIDALAARLDATFEVAQTKPESYCKALPWADAGATPPPQTFTGKLIVGQGYNATGKDEKPWILQTDQVYCDATGRAAWEMHAFPGAGGVDLKSMVDKTVEATGTIDSPMTAHHHRPILLEVTKISAK